MVASDHLSKASELAGKAWPGLQHGAIRGLQIDDEIVLFNQNLERLGHVGPLEQL